MTKRSSPSQATVQQRQPKQAGLPAREVDRRLVALTREHNRIESELCFYLREMDERRLYVQLGFASVTDYARERLGFEDRKTRSLLYMAGKFQSLPRLGEAFARGELPWTKVREAVKVATPESEAQWLEKCQEMTNRQIEKEVRQSVAPVQKITLVFVLEGERVESWNLTREALERLSGQTLTDLQAWDLMNAEVHCTYATTPPFGRAEESGDPDGGFARLVAERDGWKCTRPGCSCRTALQGNHIIPRSQGGSDEPWNIHLVCAVCHAAFTRGTLKVSGRAPDQLTWEGPFGLIEKPLPLGEPRGVDLGTGDEGNQATPVREEAPMYTAAQRSDSADSPTNPDHVIREPGHQAAGRYGRSGEVIPLASPPESGVLQSPERSWWRAGLPSGRTGPAAGGVLCSSLADRSADPARTRAHVSSDKVGDHWG